MSAINRYRTLVRNISRVYSASDGERSSVMEKGLEEIVLALTPHDTDDWNVVGMDSERLLRVWVSRENTHAAHMVASQLVDVLYELSASAPASSPSASASVPAAPPVAKLVITEPDTIAHVPSSPYSASVYSMPDTKVIRVSAPPASVVSVSEAEEEDEESEADESEVEEEADEEADEEESAAEAEAEADEEMAEEEAEEEEAEDDDEEEEDEAEEEVGMEVEQVFIRGRSYWLETNTKKLYAVEGEDDVGDEVGEMVNGKPRFFAKA